jgi:tripartite-type tricarboxylate transporter receptor subunit TctC
MRRLTKIRWCMGAVFFLSASSYAAFPDRPIRLVVPFGPGTVTDQYARALAKSITQQADVAVVVENKLGANGIIGSQYVAAARPDGYTLLLATNTTHAANQFLYKTLSYDPVRGFSPIALVGIGAQILVVTPSSPAKTLGEFIAQAKAAPGKLTFATGGGSTQVAGDLFEEMAGIKLLQVPYQSNPLALNDVLSGRVDMMITDTATALPQMRAGRLRALGVTTKTRSPLAPDVPTIDEAGVKGYEMTFWFAAYAPKNTPGAIVTRLNQLFVAAAKSEPAEQFHKMVGTTAQVTTPAGLGTFQAAEAKKWEQIIETAGIPKQ